MRELKFRYWNPYANKLVYNPTVFKEGWTLEQYFSDRGWAWEQYTGLKDKNGKEIYEGDIIDFFGERYPVIYRAGGFWAEYSKTQKDHLFLYAIDSEIVGNIHENPELLDVKKEG